MKALCAILFSVFFLLTTTQQTTFFILYKLNEKAITEQYCVNKSKVESHCNGKCHLNKTIAKSEKEDTKNPFSTLNIKIKEVEVFFNKIVKPETATLSFQLNHKSNYTSLLLEGFHTSLIKPPTALG